VRRRPTLRSRRVAHVHIGCVERLIIRMCGCRAVRASISAPDITALPRHKRPRRLASVPPSSSSCIAMKVAAVFFLIAGLAASAVASPLVGSCYGSRVEALVLTHVQRRPRAPRRTSTAATAAVS
jgi:hypothetical protein